MELAKRAETLGYDCFTVADHFSLPYAPLQLLQYIAGCTSLIRLGTEVLNNDFRHPALLAKEAATLDVLSGGRLELGLGAGWLNLDYDQTGIGFDDGPTRVARMQEAVHVLRGLFADESFSFSGRYYTIRDLDGTPKPAQRPGPPFMIGGKRRRLLGFAAREADIVSFNSGGPQDDPESWTLPSLKERVDYVREAAGAHDPELHLAPNAWAVTTKSHEVIHRVARTVGADPERVSKSVYVLVGSITQLIEQLELLRDAAGITYVSIGSERIEEFAPVVAALAEASAGPSR